MKYILWAMLLWGGITALFLAFVFLVIYIGCFFLLIKITKYYKVHISADVLKLIWVTGLIELAVLGFLYHQMPHFFPSPFAEFFFN